MSRSATRHKMTSRSDICNKFSKFSRNDKIIYPVNGRSLLTIVQGSHMTPFDCIGVRAQASIFFAKLDTENLNIVKMIRSSFLKHYNDGMFGADGDVTTIKLKNEYMQNCPLFDRYDALLAAEDGQDTISNIMGKLMAQRKRRMTPLEIENALLKKQMQQMMQMEQNTNSCD